MITIIDYKMGNLRSILKSLQRLGVEACISSEKEAIVKAEKLILPGVGSFDQGMQNLKELGLVEVLNEQVLNKKVPVLGICLGVQLFCQSSEEGDGEGLGWIDAKVVKFKFDNQSLRIPHVGWNKIKAQRSSFLLESIIDQNRFYFTHSYHIDCKHADDVLAVTEYGYEFPSIVEHDNILGVQFHPETSHKDGVKLLSNFVEVKKEVKV